MEGKQEMFCFTKWHIPNSVENYTWISQMPRQSFCTVKGNSILPRWHDLVLHILHRTWWGASCTVPPFTSPWQMHLVFSRSMWVFEIYLGPLRCHTTFWHWSLTLVISAGPCSMPQDNRYALSDNQQQQRGIKMHTGWGIACASHKCATPLTLLFPLSMLVFSFSPSLEETCSPHPAQRYCLAQTEPGWG